MRRSRNCETWILHGQDVIQNDGSECHGEEDHSYALKCLVNMRELFMKFAGILVQEEGGLWCGWKTWTFKERDISYEDWFEAPLDVEDLSSAFFDSEIPRV